MKVPKTITDWRQERMSKIRQLIKEVDPNVTEKQKYQMPSNPEGIPVWYHDGMICTGETYKQHLRLTFAKAQELKKHDPKNLFNRHSAMIIEEKDKLDETAFKKIIKMAVKINQNSQSKKE